MGSQTLMEFLGVCFHLLMPTHTHDLVSIGPKDLTANTLVVLPEVIPTGGIKLLIERSRFADKLLQ